MSSDEGTGDGQQGGEVEQGVEVAPEAAPAPPELASPRLVVTGGEPPKRVVEFSAVLRPTSFLTVGGGPAPGAPALVDLEKSLIAGEGMEMAFKIIAMTPAERGEFCAEKAREQPHGLRLTWFAMLSPEQRELFIKAALHTLQQKAG